MKEKCVAFWKVMCELPDNKEVKSFCKQDMERFLVILWKKSSS